MVKRVGSSVLGVVQETLGALRIVKAFGQERRESDRYWSGHERVRAAAEHLPGGIRN